MSDRLHTKIRIEPGFVFLKIGDIKIEDGYVRIPAQVARDIGCDLVGYAAMADDQHHLEKANIDLDDAAREMFDFTYGLWSEDELAAWAKEDRDG